MTPPPPSPQVAQPLAELEHRGAVRDAGVGRRRHADQPLRRLTDARRALAASAALRPTGVVLIYKFDIPWKRTSTFIY